MRPSIVVTVSLWTRRGDEDEAAKVTSNGEPPPPEPEFDFWPAAVWLGAGGGVPVSTVMPCCVLMGGSCIDWLCEVAAELAAVDEGVL